MAHNIEQIAFVGETPWHGLGIRVPDNLTPAQILTTAGLDWTVSKRPMFYTGTNVGSPISDRFALVRDSDEQFLDIVGKTYRPTQNKDAFEFFDKFVNETKLKMHTAGSLCGGKFVWALAQTEQSFQIGPDKDKVDSYILLVSPHQFGRALIAQQTTVRVVCNNTLNLALNEKGMASYRMTHTKDFDANAKLTAAKVLGLVTDSFSSFKDQVQELAATKIKRADVIDFYSDVLELKQATVVAANDDGLPKSRLLRQFMDAYEGGSPGANLAGTKGTLWGVINGITYVMDHVSKRQSERALRDNWFSWRGALKRKALDKALKIAA